MKLSSATQALSLVSLLAIDNSFAVANDSGWYGGLNIGQVRASINEARIASGLLPAGVTTTSIAGDNRDIGYKLFGGYQFIKYFALEGGYFDLGRFSFDATTAPSGTLDGSINLQGLNVDTVGILPVSERFSVFGRVGVIYAEARDTFAGTGSVNVSNPAPREREGNYKFGLGVEYALTRSFGIRAEAERYRIDDAVGNNSNIDFLSGGLVYRFGRSTLDLLPAAAPPLAAPVLIVVPAPVPKQQYCSILDIQFEINRDVVQREEIEKLRVVGTFLTKYSDTTAVIEGHTDSVGTPEDNMSLSQRRAESVVSYLEDTFHVAPSRLTAVGYGDTRAIAENSTEEGKRLNRRIDAIIACATDIQGLEPLPARITMALEMEFDTNRADVRPEYREELRKVASFMTAHPAITATVEGHTSDLQGTAEQGIQLSQRRAESVVNYLADNFGIARSRLAVAGFGQSRRFAYNTSAEGRQENRRINIIFNYPNESPD